MAVEVYQPEQAPSIAEFEFWAHAQAEADRAEREASSLDYPDMALWDFAREGWPVLEPTTIFHDNWHVGAVSEHLEAVTFGQIKKLIINIPPGAMKSLLACVFWFAWVWTFRPSSRWLFSSFTDKFATRDSVKSRTLIMSEWYRNRWGFSFSLRRDQNLKTYFENDKTGYRMSGSIQGGTGARGDYIVTDDPIDIDKADSDAERETAVRAWNEVWSLRGSSWAVARHVIIMQRLHEKDLTGDQLARDLGYEHLMLPMEFEPDHPFLSRTSLKFRDPRTQPGQLLDPVRFPADALPAAKKQLGSYGVAGQFQQRPAPRHGAFFHTELLKHVARWAVPYDCNRVRYWDKAGTENGGDWSVGALVARRLIGEIGTFKLYHWYIEDVVYFQHGLFSREKKIKEVAELDEEIYGEGAVETWFEQEPAASGKDVARITIINLAGMRIRGDTPGKEGNKETRARPLADQMDDGNVSIVDADWTEFVIGKLNLFPRDGKDFADAIGGAFRRTIKRPKKKRPGSGSTGAYG